MNREQVLDLVIQFRNRSMRQRVILLALLAFAVTMCGCSLQQSDPGTVKAAEETRPAGEDQEIKSALDLIDKTPDAADGYIRLASVYIRRARDTGDFSLNIKAETAVDKALAISQNDISARKLRASLHLTFHRFSEALEAGKALETEFPSDAFVYGVLTDANAELGNYDAAINAAQKMVDLKPNAASYARVAHIRALVGDHRGAVEMFRTAADITDPKDREAKAWCLVQLGDEYWKHGQFKKSEKAYDESLSTLPDYYFALAGKGRARAAAGDLQAAESFLRNSQDRVPNVETIIFLGDVYSALGNAEAAKQQYELVEVVEQRFGLNNDQKRLALLWADHDTRLDEALAIAEREYSARKDIVTADTLAWCRFKKGDLAGAKAAIEAAMKLKTDDARTLYHAAMIYRGLGDRVTAKQMLEKAIRINSWFDLVQAPIAQKELADLK